MTLVEPPELGGEAMSGEPQYGLMSNWIGVVPVVLVVTFSWLLNGETRYCGMLSPPWIGSVPSVLVADCPSYVVCEFVRGSS